MDMIGEGGQELQEFRSSGVQEFRSSGVQEFRSCRSSGATTPAQVERFFRILEQT
jgi:hypothetical protein